MDGPVRAVSFDFDGVLCHGRFYEPRLSLEYPAAKTWLQRNFFVSGNETVRRWMRGHLSSRDIHAYLEREIGVAAKEFDALMAESLRAFVMDATLLEWAARLRAAGIRTAIVSDNMDVFTRFVVPFHRLGRFFDVIVNSADHGALKCDERSLFPAAIERLDVTVSQVLHIDDSERAIGRFRGFGGRAYHLTAESVMGLDGRLSEVLVSAKHDQELFRLHHDGLQGRALRRNNE